MRLSSIELAGFKSFADRTVIRFKPGMTGIVGPNGCGKSNIVDGLKWVLGTLSKKAVRGDEMLDVIFKGAEGITPSGFAEVRLTFDNQDKTLAIEAPEVCIARRLYRSGDSQYTINGAPCRRRDICELFFGTGVGADTYAIIEQGKIARLILASSQDRRIVFDEAAGVSKYRARKKEAEGKLDRAQQDLQRVDDRLQEAVKELHSLRVQAGRASRYKELTDALKDRSLLLLKLESEALEARRLEAGRNAGEGRAQRLALDTRLQELRAQLVRDREALTAAERSDEQARGEEGRLQERRERFRHTLEQVEARLSEATVERERVRADRESWEGRGAALAEQIGRVSHERGAAHVAHEAARLAVEEFERRASEAVRECAALEERVERHTAEILELARKEAELGNDLKGLERDLEQQKTREERLRARTAGLDQDLVGLEGQRKTLADQLSGLRRTLEDRRADKKGLDSEMEGLRESLTRAQAECDVLRGDRERLTARLDTLREIEANREGLGSGVRSLLSAPPEASGDARGTVADLVEVPLPYAPAVEAALGEAAAYVVVPNATGARRAADYVREHRLDRTGIAPLEGPEPSPAPPPEHPQVVGLALDLVRPREEARGLMARLLGDALVVREPLDLPRLQVTLAGELLRPDGIRVVPGAGEHTGLITRRAEIRTLTGESVGLDTRVRELEESLSAAKESMKELGGKIDEVREGLYHGSIQENEQERELQQLERRLRLAADERRAVEAELADLDRERQVLIARHARAAQLADETGTAHRQAQAELEQLRDRLRSFVRERERVEQGLAEARGDRVRAEEQVRACDRHLADAETQRLQIEAALARLAEAEGALDGRRAEVAKERDVAAAGRDALEVEFAGLEAKVREAEARLTGARERLAAAEVEEHETHEALAQNDERLRALEISLREEEVRVELLLGRLQGEFQMTPEELAARPVPAEPVDRAALAAEVEDLKAKVARFGGFNALALERLQEVEGRVEFLKGQQADLGGSRDKLASLIKELNEEATRRFEETLKQVRENFGELFRKLFGGGKADVVMTPQEGVDPMDWGVEIMARPPKKELTTLSLLSGGEQALTALALVMSLFRANPSPFCVLDEADAALDEANVGRYTAMVQEFVQKTQVILITHRRPTMAAADILYGVSMPRAGVSTIVNVDFRQVAETAEPAAAAN